MSKAKQKGSCKDCGCKPCIQTSPRCNECCRCVATYVCFLLTPDNTSKFSNCSGGRVVLSAWNCGVGGWRADFDYCLSGVPYAPSDLDVLATIEKYDGECAHLFVESDYLGALWVESGGAWSLYEATR